jgi:hypothetical protein
MGLLPVARGEPAMALDEATLRRLSFIRHMYQLGADQSRQPEPYSAVSVLTFHDAVELFLQLAAEQLNVPTKTNTGFMEYWGFLEPKVGGAGLSQKQAMERFNRARVGFKHAGNRPSKEDIVGYRVTVANFFLENTPTVFGIDFADATLINFVKPDSARQQLVQARASQSEGNLVDALTHTAIAFYEVIEGPLEQIGPVRLGRLSFLRVGMSKLRPSLDAEETSQALEATADMLDALRHEVQDVSSTVAVLSLGLDPHRFARFRRVTPAILKTVGGPYRTVPSGKNLERASQEEIDFCISFVIETAVTLADLQP